MGLKSVFMDRLPKSEEKKRFGNLLEDEITLGKEQFSTKPGFEEDLELELKAVKRSFRRRIKRLRRKLGRAPIEEQSKITGQMKLMESMLPIQPEKFIKIIKAAALLQGLRQKPEFLLGVAKLHIIHRKYGRKPVENAKRHIKKKNKKQR